MCSEMATTKTQLINDSKEPVKKQREEKRTEATLVFCVRSEQNAAKDFRQIWTRADSISSSNHHLNRCEQRSKCCDKRSEKQEARSEIEAAAKL